MSHRKSRRDIDKAIANLLKYVEKPPWNERFKEFNDELFTLAAEELGISSETLADALQETEYQSMLFAYLFEDFAGCHWDNEEQSFIDDYLQRRGWREAAIARRYLQAMNDTQAELWEIVAVNPGQFADVQPHGEKSKPPLRVYEKSATQSLARGDCLAARIVQLDGKRIFTGGILPFPPEVAATVQDIIDNTIADNINAARQMHAEEKTPVPADLEEVETQAVHSQRSGILFRIGLVYLYRETTRPLPKLVNKEGDVFQFSTVRFPFDHQHRDQILVCLNDTPDFDYNENNKEWVWLPCAADEIPDTGVSILGHIEVTENAVEFRANSTTRAQNGEDYLKKLLAGLVKQPLTLHESLESALDRYSGQSLQDVPLPTAETLELKALKHQFMDQHYHKTLDEPIPVLDGKTPRECAENLQTQDQVIRWLKELESRSSYQGIESEADYDFGWMWKELNLTR